MCYTVSCSPALVRPHGTAYSSVIRRLRENPPFEMMDYGAAHVGCSIILQFRKPIFLLWPEWLPRYLMLCGMGLMQPTLNPLSGHSLYCKSWDFFSPSADHIQYERCIPRAIG